MSKQDVYAENEAFAAFWAEVGDAVAEDTLTRISEAMWVRKSQDGVTIYDIHQINACNHIASGTIDVGGKKYGFVFESGDRNGSVVREWGDADDVGVYEPAPVEPLTFVPRDSALSSRSPALFKVYAAWRNEGWFKDLERGYNYDRHFQPGGKTESYYRDKAAARGLVPGYLSDFSSDELAILKGAA